MVKTISIIGGGPSAFFLAAFLDAKKFKVTIYEKNKALGRKFLVAGKGGFNLSHAEDTQDLIRRYTPDSFLKEAILNFDNLALQKYLKEIGIETFVGSSKRIYPEKGIKPISVLKTILEVLEKQGVEIKEEMTWTGLNKAQELVFNKKIKIKSDYTIFALGGASWKVTGSDGSWQKILKKQGVEIEEFQASNCAFEVDWNEKLINKFEGKPLKNIAFSCLDKKQKGEAVITKFGLEGNAIYGLSPQIRESMDKEKKAIVFLDLKPSLTEEEVLNKFKNSEEKNTTDTLKNVLNLSPLQLALIKTYVSKEVFMDQKLLAKEIKGLKIEIKNTASLDEAISTSGGVARDAVDENFQLKKIKDHYCIGEMLDWDAPTGGYLLQACFSMGAYLAKHLNEK